MSSIIESLARGAKSVVTGGPSPLAAGQKERGHRLIKQLATGGLALGAGTGAAVALLNYLKSLRQEDELDDESRLNDDTLYIPGGQEKGAADGVNRWVAPGLAVTGGLLSAGGAYALTQAVYNYLQKKRRQAMLDDAQGETLAAVDEELAKKAGESMTFADLVTAFPVAVPLLAALASGGVAYAALNKTFPTVKKTKSKYPKRIRQIANDGTETEFEAADDYIGKTAADRSAEADLEDAAAEFLVVMTDRVAIEKKASISLTSDLLNRAAKEGVSVITATYHAGGLAAMVESVKGASAEPACFADKVTAAALLCKSARLAPVVRVLAAAEYMDLLPAVARVVGTMDEDSMDKMAGLAPLLNFQLVRPAMLSKQAASGVSMQQLMDLVMARNGVSELDRDDEDAMTSDVSGSLSESNEGEDGGADNGDIEPGNDDAVDQFMALEGGSPLDE